MSQGDPGGRPAPPPPPGPSAWHLRHQFGPELDLNQHGRIDPYLVWDLLTEHARHGGPSRPGHLRVLLEFNEVNPAEGLSAWCALPAAATEGQRLRDALAPSISRAPNSTIHTAVLPAALLPLLLGGVRAGALRRFELGAPCALPAHPHPARDWPVPAPSGLLHTLGLIDDGCCLAHQDFRTTDGGSRVLALWDQEPTAQANGPWQHHEDALRHRPYGYGVELAQTAASALLRAHPGLGEARERLFYRALGRPDWGRLGRDHGARVMHLLAGASRRAPAELQADRLPLVFVQLPAAVVADTSGQSLGLHVVDGARYIVARTRASVAEGSDWASTLCISMGSVAGPHDGSSMAEQALDQLAADARVRLVVAAGNCARQQLHASQVVHQHAPGRWLLRLPADKAQDTFVQLWLPAGQPAERFQLVVQAPGAPASPHLRMGFAASYAPGGGLPQAAVVWVNRPAQGLHGSLVLLALAPTTHTPGAAKRVLARPGLWSIELLASGNTPAEVHGWVERDDRVVGRRRPQQARFERSGAQASPAMPSLSTTPTHTLASLANGERSTVAGAYVVSTRRVDRASALGPRRGVALDSTRLCLAPVSPGPSTAGVAVAGFYSGQRAVLGGTSAAAPQVARWLAEGRLTEDAADALRPAAPEHTPLPADARCLPARG